jgi:hypothetical protein
MLDPWPAPLFALPLKGSFSSEGLAISVPGITTSDATVFASDGDVLRIAPDGGLRSASAIAAGDWDVTFQAMGGAGEALRATFVQGSPYVFLAPRAPLHISLPSGASVREQSCDTSCGSALIVTTPRSTFLVVASDPGALRSRGDVIDIASGSPSSLVTIAAVPPGSNLADILAYALSPVTQTRAEYVVTSNQVITTFRFPQSTLIGVLPHQAVSMRGAPGRRVGSFLTHRGTVTLYEGAVLTTVTDRPSILPSLPPTDGVRSDPEMRSALIVDLDENRVPAKDIYFGAKDIYRAATLVETADAIGDASLRERALVQARGLLIGFCAGAADAPLTFGYDSVAGGIVGMPPAFGSEHYNDHHFHWGYLIHAAAIVGRYDPSFLRDYGDCMRLLIRDIASTDRSDPSFPYLRHMDIYGGHSWAGGLTLFNDATNQESTSEAAHAWYAIALYGRTVGDWQLTQLGTWLLSLESLGTRAYWLNAEPRARTLPEGFGKPMISILWGGKSDYATFFDPSDAAIRGIQFFPATPALFAVLDRSIVDRIISPAIMGAGSTIWRSTLSLIEQLYNPMSIIAPQDPIDPVYARSTVRAWRDASRDLGEPAFPVAACGGHVFRGSQSLTIALYRFPGDPDHCTVTLRDGARSITGLQMGWNVRGL